MNLVPFRQSGILISEIDTFFDKVVEAVMALERLLQRHAAEGPGDWMDDRADQIRAAETRCDELRRSIANVMYAEMLMPDSRGDILTLLDDVDNVLDNCTHVAVGLSIERPELPPEIAGGFGEAAGHVSTAAQEMVDAARAYFKAPETARNHTHKIGVHEGEATSCILDLGRWLFRSDLPLDRKLQLGRWLTHLREIASAADDVGDRIAIYAVKRAL